MTQRVVAIIADCDDTLAPDTTSQLLRQFGVEPVPFYEGPVGALVGQGYDPSMAYLNVILRESKDAGTFSDLTKSKLQEIGRRLELFPGVPAIFRDLKREVASTYQKDGITAEFYIVSGGIADMIAASPLGEVADRIWGSNFGYDPTGKITCIKNVVSFTEKTRFVFMIQKGVSGAEYDNQPYAVNAPMNQRERRVPLNHMIYMGDGPSDIPCMSVIGGNKEEIERNGCVISIINEKRLIHTWALGYGRRSTATALPDYRPSGAAGIVLRLFVTQIADRIKTEMQPKLGITPTY